jgi:large subunit ribosomal protein L28
MLKFLSMKKAKISKLIRKHSVVSHSGHNVSHAKNRTKRKFKYNLHAVTVVLNGVKKKIRVPTSQLRQLRKAGLTTHYQKPTE